VDTVSGYVDHIVYRNEDNGYTVLSLSCEEYEEMTCVGSLGPVSEGEYLEMSGEFVEHPVYGPQLKVSSYSVREPEDVVSIERYLGSGAVRGIGKKLASAIVQLFGDDTFRIIEEEPERLAEVKGISLSKAQDISLQIDEKKGMRNAMIFLQKYGISMALSVKIYEHYGTDLYSVIKENPYRLADDIDGVGFRVADEIASRSGIRTDSEFRIRSGLLYTLMQAAAEGHVYLPRRLLLYRTGEMLGLPQEELDKFVMDLAVDRKVVLREIKTGQDDNDSDSCAVYSSSFYYMERNTAEMLHALNVKYNVREAELSRRIRRIEKEEQITLDDLQRTAVAETVRNGLLVITGGPGTGKTTTINTIIRYFNEDGCDIRLAAPTGRAARRMTEATGYEAQTIHRLLEVNAGITGYGSGSFDRNEQNPLECDVVIIDEMSMVDIWLMNALLSALTAGTRLILVGDTSQLPSVGPGSVLKDIVASHAFNVVMLTKIFRQAALSDIILNAHRINNGEPVDLSNDSKDFFFLKRSDPNRIISNMITLIQDKLPGYIEADQSEIQVITPTRKGPLGVERLNRILQQYLNPPDDAKDEKLAGDVLFRTGDKVMQIRNDYQLVWNVRGRSGVVTAHGLGVFNGDTGVITRISTFDETVTVMFDENKEVEYTFASLDELDLAYAITVHKSQGSEYPAVILPLLNGPQMLFNRNLLYTAVTRARRCVTILGSEDTVNEMIRNTREQKRYTGLAECIRETGELGG